MQRNASEIPVLDNLRGIAAWSVCLYHFVCTTVNFIEPDSYVYKTFYYGQFGVHLFFIISGMVIPWAMYKGRYQLKNIGRFMLKRLLRLEPPYFFSILLVVAVICLRKFSPTYDNVVHTVQWKQLFLHLGYLVPFFKDVTWLNNVYWTLAIEFQYYIAIGVLYFLFISPRLPVRVTGYAILLAAPFAGFSAHFLPFWLPLFGIGIVLFQYHTKRVTTAEGIFVWMLCLVEFGYFNSAAPFIVALAGSSLIHLGFYYSNSVLAFLGRSSYSVYLIHPVLGSTFLNVFSHYVSNSFSKFILVLGASLITFSGSYLMYLFIEKPSKKLSASVRYRSAK